MKFLIPTITILLIILHFSCIKQCETLENKILTCKEEVGECDTTNIYYGEACKDLEEAEIFIKELKKSQNSKEFEEVCAFAINEINFDSCKDIKDHRNYNKEFENNKRYYIELDNNFLMKRFGKMGNLNNFDNEFKFDTEYEHTDTSCNIENKIFQGKIGDKKFDLKYRILKGFEGTITSMQSLESQNPSEFFIGDKYTSISKFTEGHFNEDKFNDKNPKLSCLNDFIFFHSSSGWVDDKDNPSSCNLKQEEVYLLNWKENFFIDWCTNNYKRNYFPNSSCGKEYCDYDCIKDSYEQCKELYDDNSCFYVGKFTTEKECYKELSDKDKMDINKVFLSIYNDECKRFCCDITDHNCNNKIKECNIFECLTNGIQVNLYKENEASFIQNLADIFDLLTNSSTGIKFLECAEEVEQNGRSCDIEGTILDCLDNNCSDICSTEICKKKCSGKNIEDCKSNCEVTYWKEDLDCRYSSCYTNCEREAYKIDIDNEKSKIFVYFAENQNESSAGCGDIFDKHETRSYCTIDYKIKEKE